MAQLNTDLETIKTARDNMKTALEGQGQTVTKDIRTYAQAIANISGRGDVKLFDTVEHMQQDSTIQENDLAVVYKMELHNITKYSEFDSCIFPQEVVLSSAYSSSAQSRFMPVGDYTSLSGTAKLSSSAFSFSGNGDTEGIEITYTSSDGITYTRTDGGEDKVSFGITITSKAGILDPKISNFMKLPSYEFNGLYQAMRISGNIVYQIAPSQLDVTADCVYEKTFYGKNGIETGTLNSNQVNSTQELVTKASLYSTFHSLHLDQTMTSLFRSLYG